ncbi:hypothetical protein D3C73_1048880 [compost metagenome]
MPVFTRFCATLRSRLVALRFCSATRAPTFVLMLLAILAVLCLRRCPTPFWLPGAFCSGVPVARRGPAGLKREISLSVCFFRNTLPESTLISSAKSADRLLTRRFLPSRPAISFRLRHGRRPRRRSECARPPASRQRAAGRRRNGPGLRRAAHRPPPGPPPWVVQAARPVRRAASPSQPGSAGAAQPATAGERRHSSRSCPRSRSARAGSSGVSASSAILALVSAATVASVTARVLR